MGWIFESIIEIVLTVVSKLIEFFLSVYSEFEIDIGYDPDNTPLFALFRIDYYKSAVGLFDNIFPVAHIFLQVFQYIGYFLIAIIVLYKLFVILLNGKQGEDPVSLIGRLVLSAFGVAYSYSLFIGAEKIANYFYTSFKYTYQDITSVGLPTISDYITSPDTLFDTTGLGPLPASIIAIILFVTLLTQFVRLLLESFERYVMLGLLFYTCPLGFATLASESTSKIFSSWISMVISQFILLITNIFFMGTFYMGFLTAFSPSSAEKALEKMGGFALKGLEILGINNNSDYLFTGKSFVVTMLILIAWLTIGQKVDEHLRALGLSVAQTGKGLSSAVLTGLAATAGIAKGIKNVSGIGGSLRDNISKARANDNWKADHERKLSGLEKDLSTPLGDKGKFKNAEQEAAFMDGLSRENGDLTREGAKSFMNAPSSHDGSEITLEGKDAEVISAKLNLNPKSEENSLSQEVNGTYNPPDVSKQVASEGKISAYDSNGALCYEAGDSTRWKVPENGAYVNYQTPAGMYTEAITQGHIDKASRNMEMKLNSDTDLGKDGTYGLTWKADTTSDHSFTGTATGYDSEGKAVKQAYIDQIAKPDSKYGGTYLRNTSSGKKKVEHEKIAGSKLTYTVQDLSPEGGTKVPYTSGKYVEMKAPCKSRKLERRSPEGQTGATFASSKDPSKDIENLLNRKKQNEYESELKKKPMPEKLGVKIARVIDKVKTK